MTRIEIDVLLRNIRFNKSERDAAIASLYHDTALKEAIKSTLLSKGARAEDIQDIFGETLLQFVKTVVKNPTLELAVGLKRYLQGIAKHVWYNRLRKEGKHDHIDLDSAIGLEGDIQVEELVLKKEKYTLLHELVGKMGSKCKDVLMYWANGYDMQKIASFMDYKSSDMAKKKKFLCMKKLLLYIEQNPQIKEALR